MKLGGMVLKFYGENVLLFSLEAILHPFEIFFQSLGNSQREYEKQVVLYSIRNQLRYRNNLGEQTFLR